MPLPDNIRNPKGSQLPPDNPKAKIDTNKWKEEPPPDLKKMTSEEINTWVMYCLAQWEETGIGDKKLFEAFQEEFDGWSKDIFVKCDNTLGKVFCDHLLEWGVWVDKVATRSQIAVDLEALLKLDTYPAYPEDKLKEAVQFGMCFSPYFKLRERLGMKEATFENIAKLYGNGATKYSSRPSTADGGDGNSSVTINTTALTLDPKAKLSRALTDLMKYYYDDTAKFCGKKYEFLTEYLKVFKDNCKKVDISPDNYADAFSTMLGGAARVFYYSDIANGSPLTRACTFEEMVTKVRQCFETSEMKLLYSVEWRALDFKQVCGRPENRDKTKAECLEISIEDIRKILPYKPEEQQRENTKLDKLMNAVIGVKECSLANMITSDTFEGYCNQLRTSIGNEMRVNTTEGNGSVYMQQEEHYPGGYDEYYGDGYGEGHDASDGDLTQFWTDRRFEGNSQQRGGYRGGYRGGGGYRGNGRGRGYGGSFGGDFRGGYSYRNQSNYRGGGSYQGGYRQFNFPPNWAKKCFVCHKPGCRSYRHPQQERKGKYDQLKTAQYHATGDNSPEGLQQFLIEFEGVQEQNLLLDFPASEEDLQLQQMMGSMHIQQQFWTIGDATVDEEQTFITLRDQATLHAFSGKDMFQNNNGAFDRSTAFVANARYSDREFQGILPDTGAAKVSTAGIHQYHALRRIEPRVQLDTSSKGAKHIAFGLGSCSSLGHIVVDTPIGSITFYVTPTYTPFLYCLADMDHMRVYYNNLDNLLINAQLGVSVPVVRKWGHPSMLLGNIEQSMADCHLTEVELKQLHRRFGHPSVQKLYKLLERAGHDPNHATIKKLTAYCHQCQMHGKAPGRFKFTLNDDAEFNFSVEMDVLYLNGKPVLQVVDSATGFNAAKHLKNMEAKTAWETFMACWSCVYLGPQRSSSPTRARTSWLQSLSKLLNS